MNIRMDTTVSRLESYSRCPMEYYLKYHRGVPAQVVGPSLVTTLPGNLLGDLVHGVIREMMARPDRDAANIARKLAQEREIPEALIPVDEISTWVARALQYHRGRQWIDYRMELPFVMRLGDALVRGAIDFLGRDTAGWHVVDYKTDRMAARSELAARAKSYALQMQAYAAAAAQAGIQPVVDTALLFLRSDDVVTTPITPQDAASVREEISGIIARIAQEDWDVGRSPPCKTCPYHHNGMCWEDRLKK